MRTNIEQIERKYLLEKRRPMMWVFLIFFCVCFVFAFLIAIFTQLDGKYLIIPIILLIPMMLYISYRRGERMVLNPKKSFVPDELIGRFADSNVPQAIKTAIADEIKKNGGCITYEMLDIAVAHTNETAARMSAPGVSALLRAVGHNNPVPPDTGVKQ